MSWRDIIYLPKSDRKALVFLLIAGAILVWCFDHCGMKEAEDVAFVAEDTLENRIMGGTAEAASEQEPYYAVPVRKVERFPFDPNTADSTQFLRLGLQPWQVRNIYKYRAKGGIYREKEDFARLYGLTVKQYRELEPYIRISGDYRPAAEVISSLKPPPYPSLRVRRKRKDRGPCIRNHPSCHRAKRCLFLMPTRRSCKGCRASDLISPDASWSIANGWVAIRMYPN